MDLPIGLLDCPYNMAADFPQSNLREREGESHNVFYDPITHHQFCYTLFIRSKSLNIATLKKKGIRLYLLKEETSKNFYKYLKTTTGN